MAEDPKPDAPTTAAPPPDAPDQQRYSAEDLKENARNLLGVSPHAVEAGLYGDERESFTLKQAADLVNKALKRPHEEAVS